MLRQFVVVERPKDWSPYCPSENLITAEAFFAADPSPDEPALIINLCRDYKYLGRGYYCSLLAEARGDRVLPSVRTINELSAHRMYSPALSELKKTLQCSREHLDDVGKNRWVWKVYFGRTQIEDLQSAARQLFELFPCPVLSVGLRCVDEAVLIERVRPVPIHELESHEEDEFAAALDGFSRQIWRRPRRKRRFAHDLAILADPQESLPPSNRRALERFVQAGRHMSIDAEVIGRKEFPRLLEYDALFIRETTAVNHHTYQFAQKAEKALMPVIDDPNAILKCANKVYLAERMRDNDLPVPETRILSRDDAAALERAADELGFPMVLKIPDGSFSRGIHKVTSLPELRDTVGGMFRSSVLVLAQEYLYTAYDWRIGVLDGRPLFACRYYMSQDHWQIYNHGASGARRSGGFDTLPVEQVPAGVIRLAVRACGLIGQGLYGVDIKQCGERLAVIEVNDNPNIDYGIEDAHLGKLLYIRVMEAFFSRMHR